MSKFTKEQDGSIGGVYVLDNSETVKYVYNVGFELGGGRSGTIRFKLKKDTLLTNQEVLDEIVDSLPKVISFGRVFYEYEEGYMFSMCSIVAFSINHSEE